MRENRFRAWSGFMVLVASIAVFMFATGRFQPVTQIDTLDYANFPIASIDSALNNKRTYLYPCFLKATTTEAIPYMVVPYLQYTMAAVAAAVFLGTLLRSGWSAGMALAASMPLMTNSIVLDYCAMITPDSIAQSLAILTVSFWLRQIWLPDRFGSLLMLGLLVFLCYQTKPFYLFLIGFVPVGGVVARWWLFGARSGVARLGWKLLFCSTLPFLAWCSLRWFLVGHFGLVSFGGYNVVGIAGQMLRREDVEKLSEELRPLATTILNSRDQRVDWSSRMTYSVYETQYNPMVWQIAVPAAEKMYDGDSRRMNLSLARLSREVIGLRPVRYGIWLGHAAKRALTQSVHLSLVNPISVCSVFLMTLFFGASWLKSRRNLQQPQTLRYPVEYQTIVWLGIGFAICAMTLVILVETPLARYCAPAAVFLPSILSMGAFQSYRSFRSLSE
jgi:hypothetical protein